MHGNISAGKNRVNSLSVKFRHAGLSKWNGDTNTAIRYTCILGLKYNDVLPGKIKRAMILICLPRSYVMVPEGLEAGVIIHGRIEGKKFLEGTGKAITGVEYEYVPVAREESYM